MDEPPAPHPTQNRTSSPRFSVATTISVALCTNFLSQHSLRLRDIPRSSTINQLAITMADTEQSNKGGNPDSDVGEQGRAGDTVSSGSKPTSKFSGQIFGPGISDNATKDRAIYTAGYALNKEHNQTPNHAWMAFFTGASWTKTASPSGAYSVVFPSPNSTDHRKMAKMAWYMASSSEVVNEKRLSGLAVGQALYIAEERLRSLLNKNEERPKKATVKVFVHCVETLKNIDDPGSIGGDGREAQLEVVKLIEDLSYSLCNIAGINVRLYLQWVPADYGKMVCARDFAKRCRRKKGRKDLYYVGNDVRDAGLMPEGVSGFIERDTAEESQHDMMEESGGSAPMAEEGPTSIAEEGQAGVHQAANPDDQEMDEEEAMASDQVPNDEQASINQQIRADCDQQQIYFLREQRTQDVANQQMSGELALRQLVPDDLLPSPPSP